MTFNFDMARIGQTIARLRREHNITQMALADAMGVSFQAVSNWERGQSMPDISKLPELAELFGTTIDDLLGRHSPLIERAAEGKLEELPTGRGYADIVYLPKRGADVPALVVELKWNDSAAGAIRQIRDRQYPSALEGYGGEILLVGISYDKETRQYECSIEKWQP